MKVLVVDDSTTMRRIMSGALQKIGEFEITEVENGKEAVDALAGDSSINLVLLDWNMPVMTGIEALQAIRGASNKVPVVMVTTEAEKDKVLTAIKAGANDYLIKPFGPKEIKAKVEKFLGA